MTSMELNILLKIIEVMAPIIIAVVSIYTNNKLIAYRVEELEKKFEELEKKVEKHNNAMERIALLEQDNRAQWKRIDELKER